jgi:hypothetical protein
MAGLTYADILRDLHPINEGRDTKDPITYDSLWIHAKRYYEIDGIVAYWQGMHRHLRKALRRSGPQPCRNRPTQAA